MLLVGWLLGISFAFGAEKRAGAPFLPSRALSIRELKRECVRSERDPREEIRVQCTDINRTWVAAPPGEIRLQGFRKVTATAFAGDFHVEASQRELPIPARTGSCLRFKEIETSLTMERSVTCRELAGLKGDLSELCASVVDEARGENPKLVEVRDTGRVIDSCGGSKSR